MFNRTTNRVTLVVVLTVASACSPDRDDAERVTPSPRSGFALAYDAANDNVLLFGGSDSSFVRLNDTWTWTPDGWAAHDVPAPSPRSDAQIAYHEAAGHVVLFGGLTDAGRSRETWTWDGTQWALADSTGPAPRQLGHMAYDAAREQVILFGGSGAGREVLGDTWLWDGQAWSQANPTQSPSARGAHMMSYDRESQQVVIVGGYGTMTHADIWGWSGTTWVPRDSASTPARLHSALAFDREAGRLILYGGFDEDGRVNDTFVYGGGTWQQIEIEPGGPRPRSEHDAVFVPNVGYFSFGGVVGQPVNERIKTNETWLYRDGRWRQW